MAYTQQTFVTHPWAVRLSKGQNQLMALAVVAEAKANSNFKLRINSDFMFEQI